MMEEGNLANIVYYGALLHDIGKFLWRIRGTSSYNHAKIGAEFVQGLSKLIKPFPERVLSKEERDLLAAVIEHHHERELGKLKGREPAYSITKLISFADRISAAEREKADKETPDREKNLYSVLSMVKIKRDDGIKCCEKEIKFPFAKLSLNPPVFPDEELSSSPEEYEALVHDFLREYNELASLNLDFEISLLYLLQKYLWAVPSAYYYSKPDISLFEHLKTTAAIAISLYKEIGLDEIPSREKPYWLLIMGDISGIQNFIYTISSKGAAKGLKGRSFYIELLQRAAAKYIIEVLGLKEANIIYMGGGKVYILSNASSEEKLGEIEKHINDFLFSEFGGELYFTISSEKLSAEDFHPPREEEKNIGIIFERAFSKLENKKSKKFQGMLLSDYEKFFEPTPKELHHQICAVCGRDLTEEELNALEEAPEGVMKCKTCKNMERLGREIRNSSWIVESLGLTDEKHHFKVSYQFSDYNLEYIFFKGDEVYFPNENSIAFRVNDTEFIRKNLFASSNRGNIGFIFIGGFETDKTRIWDTFEDFASRSKGAKKLGVLRADVDYLGKVFGEGLGENRSLARLSQLSFLLKYFFSGITNTIFKKSYIIYSGGDDLFVVGPWNVLLEEMAEFQLKFREFVKNPCITFSAGFIYVNPKFPIYTFSKMAGEEEDKAKEKGKNRLSGFGIDPRWEDFYILKELKDELINALDKGLAKAYLQYLMRISSSRFQEEKLRTSDRISYVRRAIKFYRWQWHLVYQHARLKERYKKFIPLFERIEKFLKTGELDGTRLTNPNNAMKFIYLPARWAELETRKGGEE